jgi:hypothetical protein
MKMSLITKQKIEKTKGSFYTVSQEANRNCPSEIRGDLVKETGGSFTCQ